MVAVEALDHKVVLYRSDDLIDWTHLSDFGPANATGGIWECPDLFPLPVDGDPDNLKWVMVVNLNPGSVAGGSGGQYFVGDFDGTTFTSESTVTDDPRPAGTVLEDFDDGSWDQWKVANEPGNWRDGPFGDAPAAGTLPGQNPVTGFRGAGLVNGFHDGDWPVGTLTSPSSRSTDRSSTSSSAAATTPTSPAASSATSRPPGACSSRASSSPTACPWPTAAGSSPGTSSRPAQPVHPGRRLLPRCEAGQHLRGRAARRRQHAAPSPRPTSSSTTTT